MNLKLTLLSFTLVFHLSFGQSNTKVNSRIVGGELIDISKVPYYVALETFYQHRCGGSIVSNSWIISAAHCMGVNLKELFVRSGSSRSLRDGTIHLVQKAFIHPNYNAYEGSGADFDFSLLKLKNPIIYDKVRQPIKLADSNMYQAGDEALVSGLGETRNPRESRKLLRAVVLKITSDEDCKSSTVPITPNMVCAKSPNKSACSGDSGGPLVSLKHGTLLGVVSFGEGTCVSNVYPNVFGRISEAKEWINDVMENN